MTVSNQSGVIGFSNDRSTATAEFTPGVVVIANGTTYTYALAAAAIAAAGTVLLSGAYGATTTGVGSTHTHDVVAPGVLIGTYFWAKKVASAL